MQSLLGVIEKKIALYKKSGVSKSDALTKILNKLIKKRYQTPGCSADTGIDHDLYLKMKRAGHTIGMEEAVKTLQLKKEIDCLIEQRIQESSSYGSEENSAETSFREFNTEAYYHKKFQKVFDTLIDRVEDHSSSGNNSSEVSEEKSVYP